MGKHTGFDLRHVDQGTPGQATTNAADRCAKNTPELDVQQQPLGVFQTFLDADQEQNRLSPINDPMVIGES